MLAAVAVLGLTGCTVGRTDSAEQITAHKALLKGTVASNRNETGSFWFDFARVGQPFTAPQLQAVAYTNGTLIPVQRPQKGLDPATQYRYRVCSKDSDVKAAPGCGEIKTFTTPAAPSAAVSLGDSYISGEAGRWNGNSINAAGDRDGTDRAFTGTTYDLALSLIHI